MLGLLRKQVWSLTIVLSLSALSACGSAGAPADGASFVPDGSASQNRLNEKTPKQTQSIAKTGQDCGAAQGVFGPMMDEIARRFNQATLSARQGGVNLDYAGHPDAPGGVSIQACADGKIAASASRSHVYISDGLLRLLAGAAQARIATGDSVEEFNVRLDGLIKAATDGSRGAVEPELSADAMDLASSSVAFVVYHELGHTQMVKLTAGVDVGDRASAEMKADVFSVRAMKEAGYDLNGVDLVFETLQRAVPSGSMDHPSTAERAGIAQKAGRGETFDAFMD
jgi:hypothetical protein